MIIAATVLTCRTGFALLLATGSVLGAIPAARAQTKKVPTKPASAKTPAPFYAALLGSWKGTLTYRDYSSDKTVTLPTLLTVERTPNVKSLRLCYVYDDGPGKTVKETTIVTLDPSAKTYTVQTGGELTKTTAYAASGFDTFAQNGNGTLVLLGKGEDAGKPADVRNTITRSGKMLTILHEARQSGDVFKFRNRYEFTLAESIIDPNLDKTAQPTGKTTP